jgi:uncharacterized protein (DUF362 family)
MSSKSNRWTRRDVLKLAAAGIGGGVLGGALIPTARRVQQPRAAVSIFKAASYTQDLPDLIRRGLANYPGLLNRIKGRRVVLKPNLIEYHESERVNTHPALIAAAIDAVRHCGAGEVIVAEGPGHRRDMELLLEQSGLDAVLHAAQVKFVDLNLDAIAAVPLVSNYTGLGQLYLPQTILDADVLISMPKLKTHHWAGVTLSLKNMFGVVPGVKYGWPKNLLHWRGIHKSIVDINTTVQPAFAIVDGIEGMEGDGPLYGETVHSGLLVMGDNLTAVDATCARLMHIYPERMEYLVRMLHHAGVLNAGRITQLGESIEDLQQDFSVLKHLNFIKQPLSPLRRLLLVGW